MESQPTSTASLPSAVALLKEAWAIYTRRFKTLMGIEAVPTIIFIASALLTSMGDVKGAAGVLLILGIILTLAGIVTSIWSQVALILVVQDNGERLTIKEAFGKAKHLFGSFFWISILTGVIVIIGFILLIVPGIIFAVWFSLPGYVFIAEGDRGMKALRKSKAYVKGYWGAVAWRLVFAIAIVIGISIIISTLFGAVLRSETIGSIVVDILALIFGPLFVTYAYLLYKYLKQIKGPVVLPTN